MRSGVTMGTVPAAFRRYHGDGPCCVSGITMGTVPVASRCVTVTMTDSKSSFSAKPAGSITNPQGRFHQDNKIAANAVFDYTDCKLKMNQRGIYHEIISNI